jgi:tripartite-type tricarboxylate transporter receptor subunit TctC
MRLALLAAAFLFATSAVEQAAVAQSYPARPIRLIVPFPPGGSNDIVGRMVGQQLGERLGQSVVVDNRGGAGGTIGTDMAAKAAPDGHTLLLISVAHAFNPAMYRKLPYDPEKSFAPIGLVAAGPVALMVNPSVPAQSVKELIALVKASPGKYNYATAGVGSFQHLASELFKLQAGLDMVHVPYKGGGPAMMDTIAGQAQINMASLIQVIPHAKSGKLRLLATSGTKRSALFPDTPTVAETVPGYDATNWWGLVAPAGTPAPVLARLFAELEFLLKSDETKKRLENEGAEVIRMSSAEFGRFIADETRKWGEVVKQAGMQPE